MKLRNQCMGLTGFLDPIEEKIYRNITQSHISELKFACKNTIYVITFIIQIWICIQTNWQDLLNFFFRKLILSAGIADALLTIFFLWLVRKNISEFFQKIIQPGTNLNRNTDGSNRPPWIQTLHHPENSSKKYTNNSVKVEANLGLGKES